MNLDEQRQHRPGNRDRIDQIKENMNQEVLTCLWDGKNPYPMYGDGGVLLCGPGQHGVWPVKCSMSCYLELQAHRFQL